MQQVFEGSYSEDKLYEDLIEDVGLVLDNADYIPQVRMGLKCGTFTIKIYWENKC
jgi:hypothetical protein